jgi:hypothetical protein
MTTDEITQVMHELADLKRANVRLLIDITRLERLVMQLMQRVANLEGKL